MLNNTLAILLFVTKYTQLASTDTNKCTIIFDNCCTAHAPDVYFISTVFDETDTSETSVDQKST